ncbi:hypothetical protein BSLG_003791 [Batrachochytrium salamandrivorans]|nr:hypothetical protein BSLG_003791 [Batrachochytrium salamandrivorans]
MDGESDVQTTVSTRSTVSATVGESASLATGTSAPTMMTADPAFRVKTKRSIHTGESVFESQMTVAAGHHRLTMSRLISNSRISTDHSSIDSGSELQTGMFPPTSGATGNTRNNSRGKPMTAS